MSNMTVKFIGKEYSIPEDVLTYIELLDFTDSIQKQLTSTFIRKLKNEIAKDNIGLLGDKDLATEIELQVGRFITNLCDNGIFTRTISDYLKDNKGYQLYSDVNKAALEKMKSLLIREMEEWKVGYDNAVSNAESHVTGMGFTIWSSSFVNHAIYAAMEDSKLKEQSQEAETQYQKDMSDLRSRLDSQYGGEQRDYINNTYIPNMESALTAFAYELLDKYVADLIANGKFDGKTLNYVDIGRSNDLLKNLTLSNNKQAILANAFAACPYNIAVYIQAMKYDLLDYDAFQTAKEFKQDHLILSFLKESWGEVSFPTKFNINYQRINLWASLTGESSANLLRGLTEQYAIGIVKAYSRVAEMLTNKQLCRKVIGDCSEDIILAGDTICKTKAHSYVDTIVSPTIWNQLTEKCGHLDLLDRIKECSPSLVDAPNKEEYDGHLVEQLFSVFSAERKVLVAEIKKQRESEAERKAEQEKQELERKKRNKKIAAIVTPAFVAVIVFFAVLYSVVIPNKKYDTAIKLMNDGMYEDAIACFEAIDGYKDSETKIEECNVAIIDRKYNDAVALMNNGKYEEAISAFDNLNGYKDSVKMISECNSAIRDANYKEATQLIANGEYKNAYKILISLGDKEQLKHFKVVYTESYYSDKYYTSNSVYTYNEYGNLLKDVETYQDGDKKIKEYTYDSNNRLIKELITESDSPSDFFETVYEYNVNGLMIKETTTYDLGNGKASSYTYEYEYEYSSDGNRVDKLYTISENERSTTKYEYNSIGQLTKELFYSGAYNYYEYGVNCELLKKVEVDSDGKESFYCYYQYDEKGYLIKETDSLGNSIEYIYDLNYFLLKMIEYDDDQVDSVTEYSNHLVFYAPNEDMQ